MVLFSGLKQKELMKMRKRRGCGSLCETLMRRSSQLKGWWSWRTGWMCWFVVSSLNMLLCFEIPFVSYELSQQLFLTPCFFFRESWSGLPVSGLNDEKFQLLYSDLAFHCWVDCFFIVFVFYWKIRCFHILIQDFCWFCVFTGFNYWFCFDNTEHWMNPNI